MVSVADRDIEKLAEPFKSNVDKAMLELPQIFVVEAYRSQDRHDYLWSLGRTRGGNRVTWVKRSNHTLGIAIDIAFYGDELYPKDIIKWREVADIFKKYNIDWGYDLWKKDKPHFQQSNKTIMDPILERKLKVFELLSKDLYEYAEEKGASKEYLDFAHHTAEGARSLIG